MPFPTDWCISVVKFKTVAEKSRCKHFCRERVPPSWANTNGHNSNGLRTVKDVSCRVSIGPLILLSRVVYVTRKPPFDHWSAEKLSWKSPWTRRAKYRKTNVLHITRWQSYVCIQQSNISIMTGLPENLTARSGQWVWIFKFSDRTELRGIWIALLPCRLSNSIVFKNFEHCISWFEDENWL